MNQEIKVTHRDHEITYNEATNTWGCELFSRGSYPDSLEAARKRVDSHLDKVKKDPFRRFDIMVEPRYNLDTWQAKTVTSMTDDCREAWLSDGKHREKKTFYGDSSLFPATERNLKLIQEWKKHQAEIFKLEKLKSALKEKMDTWKPGDPTPTTVSEK